MSTSEIFSPPVFPYEYALSNTTPCNRVNPEEGRRGEVREERRGAERRGILHQVSGSKYQVSLSQMPVPGESRRGEHRDQGGEERRERGEERRGDKINRRKKGNLF